MAQGVIVNTPTVGEGSMKAAAAARRAKGRQAESTKKGGGEREWWRDIGCLHLLIAEGNFKRSPNLFSFSCLLPRDVDFFLQTNDIRGVDF